MLVALGCSAEAPLPAPAVDLVAAAAGADGTGARDLELEGIGALSAAEDGALGVTEVLTRGAALLAQQAGASHAGPWVGAVFGDVLDRAGHEPARAELHLALLPIDRSKPYRIEFEGAPGEAPIAFCYALDVALERDALRSAETMERALRHGKTSLRWLGAEDDAAPAGPQDEPADVPAGARLGARFTADDEAQAVLLGVLNGAGGAWRMRIESPLASLLRGSRLPDRPDHVRSLRVDGSRRECIVLPAGGRLAFTVRLPREAAELRCSFTSPLHQDPTPLACEVAVEAPGFAARLEQTAAGSERRWHEARLDLRGAAGKDVRVTFRVRAASGRSGADADAGPIALAAFGCPVIEPAPPQTPSLPHDVVLVSLDTVRADRTSPHGGDAAVTPALARLAQSAVVFESAFAAAPWTLPSHATLFTGMQPDRHGTVWMNSSLPADTPALAEAFRAAGYRCVAFTGGGFVNPEYGFARGFESFDVADPAYPHPDYARSRPEVKKLQEQAARNARARDELLALLRAPRPRPLFLFVHTYAAHNYVAPPAVLRQLGASEGQLEQLRLGVSTTRLSRYLSQEPRPPDATAVVARARFLYDAGLHLADALLGDVLAALEAAGRLDRTILVVTSDHGEEIDDHGRVGHGRTVYDELLHVPLLVRAPGVPAARVPDLVSLADVAPTLRALAGLPAAEADGRDLSALLHGGRIEPQAVLARGNDQDVVRRALRGPGEKLILSERPGHPAVRELFDLRADPRESNDLASGSPERAARLEHLLRGRVSALLEKRAGSAQAQTSGETNEALRALGYLGGDDG